jgi:hypothetical protein
MKNLTKTQNDFNKHQTIVKFSSDCNNKNLKPPKINCFVTLQSHCPSSIIYQIQQLNSNESAKNKLVCYKQTVLDQATTKFSSETRTNPTINFFIYDTVVKH